MRFGARLTDTTGRARAGLRVIESMRAKNLADAVGELVVEQTRHRFDKSKRGPDGDRWQKWSPAYARSKLRRSTPGGVLSLFGFLRKSIKPRTSMRGGLDSSVVKVGPVAGGVESGVADYADVHQFGSRKKSGRNTPARPYLGLSDRDEAQVENLAIREMQKAWSKWNG